MAGIDYSEGTVLSTYYSAPRCHAYVLRLWETRSVPPDPPVTWRFSLEDPSTGERWGFSDLRSLIDFLEGQVSVADCSRDEREGAI